MPTCPDDFGQNRCSHVSDRFVIRSDPIHMGDTIFYQVLGLAALAILPLYLRAKHRRQVSDRIDKLVRDLPEFLRNPKPYDSTADVGNRDLPINIHPWGGRRVRPRSED